MRTTVTLDSDVERLVRRAMERSRKSFKQVLNEALRRALRDADEEEETRAFVVEAKPMKARAGFDPARFRDLDDEMEAEEFLRKTRALEKAGK